MEDFEEIFVEEDKLRNSPQLQTAADKVVIEAETEFKGYSIEEQSRQSEEEEIHQQIKALRKKFNQYKNIKNPRLRHINEERAKKRKEISRDIELCKIRLQEIQEERKGANVTPQQLVNASMKDEKTLLIGAGDSISNWNL